MLVARLIMFIGIQVIFALGFLWAGNNAPWESAANWWPFAVTITNLVCIVILVRLYAQGGERFWDVFRIQTDHIKTDLLALLITQGIRFYRIVANKPNLEDVYFALHGEKESP